jgi:hypothetical protein
MRAQECRQFQDKLVGIAETLFLIERDAIPHSRQDPA